MRNKCGLVSLFVILIITVVMAGCGASSLKAKNQLEAARVVKDGGTLIVDYDMTVEQMIAAGQYTWYDPQIKEKFTPYQGPGMGIVAVKFGLVDMPFKVSAQVARDYLSRDGMRPATLAELLALGQQYPYIQQYYSVFALNLPYVNGLVPFLDGNDHQRDLGLWNMTNISSTWDPYQSNVRFLVIYPEKPRGGG